MTEIILPDFSTTQCNKLSMETRLDLEPSVRESLLKIAGPDYKTKMYFDRGENRYVTFLTILPNEETNSLDIEIRFGKVLKKDQVSPSTHLIEFFKILIEKKVRFTDAFILSNFRYPTSKFESKIQLPVAIPMIPAVDLQDPVIKGIRLELKDADKSVYSHTIDLYESGIFHNINFEIPNGEINESLLQDCLNKVNKLSLLLINLKT